MKYTFQGLISIQGTCMILMSPILPISRVICRDPLLLPMARFSEPRTSRIQVDDRIDEGMSNLRK